MGKPVHGETVAYRLASGANAGQRRVAIIVGIVAEGTGGIGSGANAARCDLYVFGRPADGAPFTAGPAFVANVSRDQHNDATLGTWTQIPKG